MPSVTMYADRLEVGAGTATPNGQQAALHNLGEDFGQK